MKDALSLPDQGGLIFKAANWAYDRGLSGVPSAKIESAQVLADSYLKQAGTIEEQMDSLIRWQVLKAGSAGFVTGLGGFITIPLTLPANLTSVMFIQLRSLARIS